MNNNNEENPNKIQKLISTHTLNHLKQLNLEKWKRNQVILINNITNRYFIFVIEWTIYYYLIVFVHSTRVYLKPILEKYAIFRFCSYESQIIFPFFCDLNLSQMPNSYYHPMSTFITIPNQLLEIIVNFYCIWINLKEINSQKSMAIKASIRIKCKCCRLSCSLEIVVLICHQTFDSVQIS